MTGNVLIVDDDQSMAETLTKAMSRHEFVVTWKTSASGVRCHHVRACNEPR